MKLRTSARGLLIALAILTLPACRQDMHDQAKLEPLEASAFFGDGMAARQPVEGTVARGLLRADRHLYDGVGPDGAPAATFPFPVTREILTRGQERFGVYCSPCHGLAGTGEGMIVERGFTRPVSFHDERLRQAPPGYFYGVITNGFGQMASYAGPVAPRDRWAIVAYIRALQLSQDAPAAALSPEDLARLDDAGGGEARARESTP